MPYTHFSQSIISVNLHESTNIFNFINNGILITDEYSKIIYTNPAFTHITGYTKEEAYNNNPGI